MRSITWRTPAGYGYGVITTLQEIRVNKTKEQHCRSQFAKADGALKALALDGNTGRSDRSAPR
jgi:hypothetical protein